MKIIKAVTVFLSLPMVFLGVLLYTLEVAGGEEVTPAGTTPSILLQDALPGLTFDSPTDIANAGDDRLFIAEIPGSIWVVDTNTLSATQFLTLDHTLSSLVFHPQYATNGYFYVMFTDGGDFQSRVSRFQVTADPNVADPASELPLISADGYAGGDLSFGPDGYLYISWGQNANDSPQSLAHVRSKVLRIDVDNTDPGRNYAIPPDNPFVGQSGVREETWLWGFRAPWRFSFDSLTGDLYISDVGEITREEVNLHPAGTPAGANYGWNILEGSVCNNPPSNCDPTNSTILPTYEYARENGLCAVIGGFVYRGTAYPALDGYYFFADYCKGAIIGLSPDGSGGLTETVFIPSGIGQATTFGEDANGEIYLTHLNEGRIFRLEENATQPILTLEKTAPLRVNAGEPITYTLLLNNFAGFTGTNIIVNDTLPANASYVSGGTLNGNIISWTVPILPIGDTISLQFVVTATQTIFNTTYSAIDSTGATALGQQDIVTLIGGADLYLPVINKDEIP